MLELIAALLAKIVILLFVISRQIGVLVKDVIALRLMKNFEHGIGSSGEDRVPTPISVSIVADRTHRVQR
jgi:hypothetical protein